MGLFIVRQDLRGHGIGTRLWLHRRDLLRSRLDADAPIEMDGVFAMQSWYAKGGFALQHRELRFAGVAHPRGLTATVGQLVDLAALPCELVDDYDRRHFPAARSAFLRLWTARPGGHAIGILRGDAVAGFVVSRPSQQGHRIGPLFADDPSTAECLLEELSHRLAGDLIHIDVPEVNEAATKMVMRRGMAEVFGCAKMTLGPAPRLPWQEIFGVTTLEVG